MTFARVYSMHTIKMKMTQMKNNAKSHVIKKANEQ